MFGTADDIVGLLQQPMWSVRSEPADVAEMRRRVGELEDENRRLAVSAGDAPKGSEVNHPGHYNAGRFEAIDVIEDTLTRDEFRGFCLGNVMKYVMRARHKGGLTDLRKAEWYMRRLIESEEEGNGE